MSGAARRWAGALLAAAVVVALPAGCRRAAQPAGTGPEATPAPTPVPQKVVLFFPGDDTLLHREFRQLPALPAASSSRARLVVEELMGGSQQGWAPVFPWAATLEDVFVDARGDAYLDLSSPPPGAVEGTSTEMALVYGIVSTVVANCPGVARVQLLFDGKQVTTLGHLDLSRPLPARPELVAP